MDITQLIENLNSFARQNTFLSIVILAILGNFLTKILEKLFFYFATKTKTVISATGQQVSNWSIKNTEYLVGHYKDEVDRVEKIKNYEKSEIYFLLEALYNNIIFIFLIFVIYLIIEKTDNHVLFYGFLGSSSWLLFKVIANTIYNHSLFEKAKNYERYKAKMEKKITRLEKLLSRNKRNY